MTVLFFRILQQMTMDFEKLYCQNPPWGRFWKYCFSKSVGQIFPSATKPDFLPKSSGFHKNAIIYLLSKIRPPVLLCRKSWRHLVKFFEGMACTLAPWSARQGSSPPSNKKMPLFWGWHLKSAFIWWNFKLIDILTLYECSVKLKRRIVHLNDWQVNFEIVPSVSSNSPPNGNCHSYRPMANIVNLPLLSWTD